MRKVLVIILVQAILLAEVQAQTRHIINSRNISKPDTVWVFTPEDYQQDPAGTYPLIYLLHGWSGTYHQWNDIMDCQAYADRYRFIIVCPDGLYDSWYINSPVIEDSRFADFFYFELMPFVAGKYRIQPENIFITGLSMGGYGALSLFAEKPELFKSAGSLSGVLDLTGHWNEYGINRYLGIQDQQSGKKILEKYSVLENIDMINHAGKPIIISCGTSDPFYSINTNFRLKCEELKINATFISSPGRHDYPYWKSAIGYHFDFFSRILKTPR